MASSMNILGTYSGITMDTIEQLVQAESGKVVKFTNDQKALEKEKSAWKDIQTRLTNLSDKLSHLMKPETFQSKKVTLSKEGSFTLKADPAAISGDYSITVKQLATRTQMTGSKLTLGDKKLSDALGKKGEFTVSTSDTKTTTISITEDDSIENIVDRINASSKESGVSAVVIDNRLVFQSTELGKQTIEGSGDLTSDLGLESPTQVEGKNAELTVNGIDIERNSNHITDITEGVTIDLIATTTDPVRVTLTDDLEKTSKAVKDFVDQYNSTLAFIGEQLDVGDPSKESNTTGALTGDSGLMRLQSQLRSMLTQPVSNGNKEINKAEAIGITVDRYGVATLDSTKLNDILQEDSKAVSDLFNFTKKTTSTMENGTTVTTEEGLGLAQKFNTLLNTFTDSKEGIIATKNETYDKMIKDLGGQIEKFNERLEVKRQQYIEKFTALDIAMMEAESQLSYLMSQVNTNTAQN